MKNWTKPAITILALAAMSHGAHAQRAATRWPSPWARTRPTPAASKPARQPALHADARDGGHGDEQGRDGQGRHEEGRHGQGGDGAGEPDAISSTAVDLSKHVGHKVAVTGGEAAMGKDGEAGRHGQARRDGQEDAGLAR